MWVLNQLWVVGPQPGLEGRTLSSELDRLHAGCAHRRAVVTDDATGARLAGELAAAGYRGERIVTMPHQGAAPQPPAGVAREIGWEAWRALERACARDDPSHPPGTAEALMGGQEALRRRPGTRMFAGARGGLDACVTTLYSDGTIALVDSVTTLRAHRGHGLASATVALATQEALAAGHELVLVNALEGSDAQRIYARLGFRAAGRSWVFTRPPG